MDTKNIVIARAKNSTRIHAFNLMSYNKRVICSLELSDVGPLRFDAFLNHPDNCKTCERQVIRWKSNEKE
jgi:hypothetical protein